MWRIITFKLRREFWGPTFKLYGGLGFHSKTLREAPGPTIKLWGVLGSWSPKSWGPSPTFTPCHFWIIPKIASANFLQAKSWYINYSTSICPFQSGKCGKKGKITKIWISREQKEIFRWNKKHCSLFFKGYNLVEKIIW